MRDPDATPHRTRLPDFNTMHGWRRQRHRLIGWLARGDAVVMNVEMVIPPGSALRLRSLDAKHNITNCSFIRVPLGQTSPAIPGTEIMENGD